MLVFTYLCFLKSFPGSLKDKSLEYSKIEGGKIQGAKNLKFVKGKVENIVGNHVFSFSASFSKGF